MKKIVESFRERFTYPSIGYVKIPDEESEDVGRSAFNDYKARMKYLFSEL